MSVEWLKIECKISTKSTLTRFINYTFLRQAHIK